MLAINYKYENMHGLLYWLQFKAFKIIFDPFSRISYVNISVNGHCGMLPIMQLI